jgi:hypothetical protein
MKDFLFFYIRYKIVIFPWYFLMRNNFNKMSIHKGDIKYRPKLVLHQIHL